MAASTIEFPVASLKLTKEQIATLKAPLPPEAVKPHPTKDYLSTIKVIYVVERLNEVFGIDGWTTEDQVIEKSGKMVVVHTTFRAPEYGIVKSAFGGNDNSDLGDAYKGACTDALSKIGSYLYIGMDVYKGLESAPKKQAAPARPAPKTQPEERKTEGEDIQVLKLHKVDAPSKDRKENPMLAMLIDRINGRDMALCWNTKLFDRLKQLEGTEIKAVGIWMKKGFCINKIVDEKF